MTCSTCSKPLGNDRFCIGPLTAPHPAMYPRRATRRMWTDERVPVEVLMAEQGITGPQGLDALADPEWRDDEQDRAYLAIVLDDEMPPALARDPFLWPHRKAV